MKWAELAIRVSKGKTSNNNNILAKDKQNKSEWILERSRLQA